VSAKYKGAFCEAKVRSVDKLVKCRVTFKMGLGSTTISDKDIKTDKPLVQGATVLARHPDKQEYFEAIVKEIKVSTKNYPSIQGWDSPRVGESRFLSTDLPNL
jgi:Ras-related protein Rab-1A